MGGTSVEILPLLECGTSHLTMQDSQLTLDASVWFFAGQVGESEPVRHIPVGVLPFRIGRRSDCQLAVPCRSVSKEHAEIFESGGSLWVRDLQSTNGTYVNGERVTSEVELKAGDLIQFATIVFRVGRDSPDTMTNTVHEDSGDRALAMIQFERLISNNAVVPFLQPIVTIETQQSIGYEVLGRSRLFGLMSPREMFDAASQLNMEAELSRVFRSQGVRVGTAVAPGANLFVNTHPLELDNLALLKESLRDLRNEHPTQPITLEIHESAVTDLTMIAELREYLQSLEMLLAYDDFGAGQARLVELTEVRPEFLKFDMKLVQGIDRANESRQQFVASLVRMVTELGIVALAEGVETEGEHTACRQLGFELAQGFFYGRPSPPHAYSK